VEGFLLLSMARHDSALLSTAHCQPCRPPAGVHHGGMIPPTQDCTARLFAYDSTSNVGSLDQCLPLRRGARQGPACCSGYLCEWKREACCARCDQLRWRWANALQLGPRLALNPFPSLPTSPCCPPAAHSYCALHPGLDVDTQGQLQ